MKPFEILNTAIIEQINNKSFMNEYKERVIHENIKSLPIWTPIEIFIQMTREIDSLINATSGLVDLENPARYLLVDILSAYIESDNRFSSIRKQILL